MRPHIDYMPYPNVGTLDHPRSRRLGAHKVEQLIQAFQLRLSRYWCVSLNRPRWFEEHHITKVNGPSEITQLRSTPHRLTWSAHAN
jgi:hypothetical protein